MRREDRQIVSIVAIGDSEIVYMISMHNANLKNWGKISVFSTACVGQCFTEIGAVWGNEFTFVRLVSINIISPRDENAMPRIVALHLVRIRQGHMCECSPHIRSYYCHYWLLPTITPTLPGQNSNCPVIWAIPPFEPHFSQSTLRRFAMIFLLLHR